MVRKSAYLFCTVLAIILMGTLQQMAAQGFSLLPLAGINTGIPANSPDLPSAEVVPLTGVTGLQEKDSPGFTSRVSAEETAFVPVRNPVSPLPGISRVFSFMAWPLLFGTIACVLFLFSVIHNGSVTRYF